MSKTNQPFNQSGNPNEQPTPAITPGSGQMPKDSSVYQPPSEDQFRDMMARLAQAEEEIKRRDEAEASLGRGVLKSPLLRAEKGNWKFKVGPRDAAKWHPHLAPEIVETVDESEAIRWYCATHEDPDRKGKQVDPVHIPIVAEIVQSRERQLVIQRQQRLAFLRNKAANGTLTPEEQQTLLDADYGVKDEDEDPNEDEGGKKKKG